MVMSSALDVLAETSRAAYRAFHRDWDRRVAAEGNLLRELGADLYFPTSDIWRWQAHKGQACKMRRCVR